MRQLDVSLWSPTSMCFWWKAGARLHLDLKAPCGSSKRRDGFEHGQLRCVGHLDCSSEGRNILESGLVPFCRRAYTKVDQTCRVRELSRVTVVESTESRERANLATGGMTR